MLAKATIGAIAMERKQTIRTEITLCDARSLTIRTVDAWLRRRGDCIEVVKEFSSAVVVSRDGNRCPQAPSTNCQDHIGQR
jgi:hypothetical protein